MAIIDMIGRSSLQYTLPDVLRRSISRHAKLAGLRWRVRALYSVLTQAFEGHQCRTA